MDYDSIASLHKTDPAFLVLRKEWLPLAVSFLHHIFKRKHEVQILREVFREKLDIYLENINQTLPEDARYRHDADYYIERWSREDHLIRVSSRDDGYVVLLSTHAERVIGWFEDMQNRGMIGTESRLRTILSLLDEVVTRSTEDVEARLRQLYAQRDQIAAEITRIEETQQIDGLTDIQIRERLDHISTMANQLLRDFGQVEERFREIARSIQQAQLNPDMRRGEIIGTALDADEQLEVSDEGQSFRAFYELLTLPGQRERFDDLIGSVFSMPRLARFADGNAILQRLTSYLLDAGERINLSNQRLAEHLRRVVDTRNVIESRRVQGLSREIKHSISQMGSEVVPLMGIRNFYSIEGDPEVELPLERPLFDPPEQVAAVERPRPASMLIDDEALADLYNTFFIDEALLREHIMRQLMSHSEISLAELVNSYPVTRGMAEVIAYFLIAARESYHMIEPMLYDEITIQMLDGDQHSIVMPRVIFRRPAKQAG